jgi:hypothetical protein
MLFPANDVPCNCRFAAVELPTCVVTSSRRHVVTALPREIAGWGKPPLWNPWSRHLSNFANIKLAMSTANHNPLQLSSQPNQDTQLPSAPESAVNAGNLVLAVHKHGLGVHIKLQTRIEPYSVSIVVPSPQRNVQSSDRSTKHQALRRHCTPGDLQILPARRRPLSSFSSFLPLYAPCCRQFLAFWILCFFSSFPSRSILFLPSIPSCLHLLHVSRRWLMHPVLFLTYKDYAYPFQ